MDRITTALGYASLSDRIVHFGLGRQTPIRANRNRLAIGRTAAAYQRAGGPISND
jgi:hypothetical protein